MANTEDIGTLIEHGDIYLGHIEWNIHSSALVQNVIARDELIVVSSDKDLTQEYFIDSLAQKKWILREKGSGTRSIFLEQIAPIDKELNIVLELEQTEAIKNFLLQDNDYISCLPRISVLRELQAKELFHVKIKSYQFMREFSLIYNKKRTPTLLMQDFQQHILEFMKKVPI